MSKRVIGLWGLLVVVALLVAGCAGPATPAATPTTPPAPTPAPEEFLFGIILVGPKDDHGWSEAHHVAAEYAMERVPGSDFVVYESLIPGGEVTLEQVVDDMVAQGAKLILTTSDAFEEDTIGVAEKYPEIVFINVSGDDVLTGEAPSNEGNFMGEMEYMKGVAGCTAALMTDSGTIAYLGPLINDETRRLASAAYLGARYCYEHYRGLDPGDLRFIVTWIGFWFNLPGVTLDPTVVANGFFDEGADVVISGIDTTEGLVVAKQRADQGERAFAIPYDYVGACDEAPDICLGVPYFNWGPAYLSTVKAVIDGTWKQGWDWNGADWSDINNPDTSHVGFVFGDGLPEDEKAQVQEYISGLASGDIKLFVGPLNYQDGTTYLAEGEVATDEQIWYLKQLLEGMEGPSE
ncbi:MAG: BMP family ABC transporter substrate-binding protein [Anaerolineae bacterium]